MPVDSKEVLRSVGGTIGKLPVIGRVTKNPFYTAVVIVIVFMLITVIVFRDTPGVMLMAGRVGVYGLVFATGIQFLQNKQIIDEYKSLQRNDIVDSVFDPLAAHSDSRVEVTPTVGSGDGYIPPTIVPSFL